MKRRFDGVARNWLPRWWTARSTEFGYRVAADHGRKKRPDHRRHLAGAGRTRNGGRPGDRPDHLVSRRFGFDQLPQGGDPVTGQIWVRSSLRSLIWTVT